MNECKIVEDLLPLYEEDLIQLETKKWIHEHLAGCPSCSEKLGIELQLPKQLEPSKSAERMIAHTKLKLHIYQIFIIILSFIFAMSTTLFINVGFQFILSYFILGAMTFYFYRSWLLTIVLSFLPVFIWTIYDSIYSFGSLNNWIDERLAHSSSIISSMWEIIYSGIVVGFIHTIFAVIGIVFVFCLLRAFKDKENGA